METERAHVQRCRDHAEQLSSTLASMLPIHCYNCQSSDCSDLRLSARHVHVPLLLLQMPSCPAHHILRNPRAGLWCAVTDVWNGTAAGMDFQYRDPERGFDRSAVKGVVAKLVRVKDSADATALEVAAGGKLYQVIVDTEATAKALLSKGQLRNRVTIVPLNKASASCLLTPSEPFYLIVDGVRSRANARKACKAAQPGKAAQQSHRCASQQEKSKLVFVHIDTCLTRPTPTELSCT